MTLNQLKIFWAVVHSPSLTQAAKQLGMSQPSLSQHLAKLEAALGRRLFDRVNNGLTLSDAGRYLLRKAEAILAEMDEIETAFAAFGEGRRARVAIGALSSLARSLLPGAQARLVEDFPDLELDVHELSPGDAIDQLYGRTIQIALLSAASIAANRTGFTPLALGRDAYVLATPPWLALDGVDDVGDLDTEARATLDRTIQFNFGNQHNNRIEAFFRQILPRHRVVATCRAYETALALVERGGGVAIVPQMAAELHGRPLFDVRLHATPLPARTITALVPSQNRHLPPIAAVLGALEAAGEELRALPVAPVPGFIAAALAV